MPAERKAAGFVQMNKIAGWCPASKPFREGIIKPKPGMAINDFQRLMQKFLSDRGMDRTRLEFVGNHEGWLEYILMKPVLKSAEARVVSENWNDEI